MTINVPHWIDKSNVCVLYLVQLEESEFACTAAVKARKSMELEIEDLHIQMDDITKAKMAVSHILFYLETFQWSEKKKF